MSSVSVFILSFLKSAQIESAIIFILQVEMNKIFFVRIKK
jgi:hypothetical protein